MAAFCAMNIAVSHQMSATAHIDEGASLLAFRNRVDSVLLCTLGMSPKGAEMAKTPHETDIWVGARARVRRLELGLSQSEVGHRLGITFQQIQKYEKGTNRIGASRLQALAGILEVPVGYFFPDPAPETIESSASSGRGSGLTSYSRCCGTPARLCTDQKAAYSPSCASLAGILGECRRPRWRVLAQRFWAASLGRLQHGRAARPGKRP